MMGEHLGALLLSGSKDTHWFRARFLRAYLLLTTSRILFSSACQRWSGSNNVRRKGNWPTKFLSSRVPGGVISGGWLDHRRSRGRRLGSDNRPQLSVINGSVSGN